MTRARLALLTAPLVNSATDHDFGGSGRVRRLRPDELAFMRAMLAPIPERARFEASLCDMLVRDMPDGGMGGITFVSRSGGERKFGGVLAECEFEDEDGVGVLASIFLDEQGELLELDVFKGDFSPLQRLPAAGEIRMRTPHKRPLH